MIARKEKLIMRHELEDKLVAKYPKWFNVKGNIQHTLMPFGFEHEDGWFDLLMRLCEKLEPLVKAVEEEFSGDKIMSHFEVLQVKEKFGGLRFYTNWSTDEIFKIINEAENESYSICEVCGAPGKCMNRSSWLKTVCQQHADEIGYKEIKKRDEE